MADTSFNIELGVAGAAAVDTAALSLAQLADKLKAAGDASDKAKEALREGEAAYRAAESAADKAAKKVEDFNVKLAEQKTKMEAAMKAGDETAFWKAAGAANKLAQDQEAAAKKAKEAADALSKEAEALDKLKAASKGADAAKESLTKAHGAAKQADASFGKVSELAAGFGALGGPLGRAGQKAFTAAEGFKKLGTSLGAAGPYAAIAVALVAIATAAIVATAAIIKFGIENADAARTSQLLSAGVMGSVAGGEFLDDQIAKLTARIPVTREELNGMAKKLKDAGKTGKEFADGLEEAAIKAAKLKYGPDFERQTLSLPSQLARLKDNISGPKGIFSGLKIEGLLTALSKVVDLFSATSESGKAIKTVFEGLFQPLVDGITNFIPKAIGAFLQFEILVMKALIAIKPFHSKIEMVAKVFGILALVVVGVLAVALGVMVGMAMLSAAVLAAIVFVGYKLFNFFIDVAKAVWDFSAAIAAIGFDFLSQKFTALVEWLKGFSLVQMGLDMVNGLIEGIKSAAGGILTAMTDAVKGAVDGAKKFLGIASPSKVMFGVGVNTGEGVEGGLDAKAGDVQSALESMVSPPAAPSINVDASTKNSGAQTSSQNGAKNFSGAQFIFNGVQGAEDAIDRFLAIIEGDAAQLATAVPNGG